MHQAAASGQKGCGMARAWGLYRVSNTPLFLVDAGKGCVLTGCIVPPYGEQLMHEASF